MSFFRHKADQIPVVIFLLFSLPISLFISQLITHGLLPLGLLLAFGLRVISVLGITIINIM